MSKSLVALLALLPLTYATFCGQSLDSGSTCTDYRCPRNVSGFCVRGLGKGMGCSTNSDCDNDLICVNTTCVTSDQTKGGDQIIGYVAVVVGIVFWGSNFIPVKKYETGNGMYFQWVMATGIWFVGLIVQLCRPNYVFYEYAMIGGVVWASGNLLTVFNIRCIGIGLGLAIWGSTNMVIGWGVGHFGLFGVDKEDVNNPGLNYVALTLSILATLCFALVKPNDGQSADGLKTPTNRSVHSLLEEDPFDETFSKTQQRLFGITGSVISGLFYATNLAPPLHLIDNYQSLTHSGDRVYSNNAIDYVFSHFCGIYFAATIYFAIYCVVRRRTPTFFPDVNYQDIALPALISGAMWACAQTACFIASANLGMVVAYPLMCTGPGLLGSIWGVVLFREITGKRNLGLLALAFALVAGSALCASLSTA